VNIPPIPTSQTNLSVYYCDRFYDNIQEQIKSFELRNDEILIAEMQLNDGSKIRITDFGYRNPTLMIIYGIDRNSHEVQVLTSLANIQIVLTIIKKAEIKEVRPIGFKN